MLATVLVTLRFHANQGVDSIGFAHHSQQHCDPGFGCELLHIETHRRGRAREGGNIQGGFVWSDADGQNYFSVISNPASDSVTVQIRRSPLPQILPCPDAFGPSLEPRLRHLFQRHIEVKPVVEGILDFLGERNIIVIFNEEAVGPGIIGGFQIFSERR